MFDPNIGAGTRWKKGSSGNPGGRPRTRLLSEALRSRLARGESHDDPYQRTYAEIVAENLVEIACSEGPGAIALRTRIADRSRRPRPTSHVQISDLAADLQSPFGVRNLSFIWRTTAGRPTRNLLLLSDNPWANST